MKKRFVIMLCMLLICESSFAVDDLYRQFQIRKDALKQIQSELLRGKIPVYFEVSCKDTLILNRLKSLLASKLRKKDNVKIVYERDYAYLWLYLIAIKVDKRNVAVTMTFGNDADVSVSQDYEKGNFYLVPANMLRYSSFTLFLYDIPGLQELVSVITDKFDVEAIEPVRRSINK